MLAAKTKGTMKRRILMTGKEAKYINIHTSDVRQDDRDVLLTGEKAEYVELTLNSKL